MSQLSVFSSRYQLRHHSKIKRHIHFHLIFYSCFYFRNIAYCFNCLYVKYTILFRRNKNVLFVCLNPTGGKNIQIGKFMENPKKKKKNILLFLRSSSILPFSSLVWFILPPSLVIPSFSSWPRSGVRGRYAHAVCQWLQQSSGHPAAISVWGGAAQVQTHRAETHCKVTQPLPPPPQTPLQTGVEKLLYITPLFLLQTTSVSVLLQIPYNLLGLCRSSPLYPVTESHSLNFQLSWKMPFHTALHISKLIYDTFHSLVNWVHTTSIGYTNRGRVNGIFEMCAVAWENPSHAEIFLYV